MMRESGLGKRCPISAFGKAGEMIEKIVLLSLSIIFLGLFVTRNIIVMKRTKQQVRSKDQLVAASILVSSLCFFVAIASTFSTKWYHSMGEITALRHPFISYTGLFLFGAGIWSGWLISAQLKDSWRVGVPENQSTELIRDGIYAYVRNPYFLSYYVMFTGLFLFRPSLMLLFSVLAIGMVFHIMVLREEAYLLKVHGEEYEKYKIKAGRYFPRFS
jgi:protein-S-isoprenylcysteine O-methyltransferase Ste14